MTDVPFALGCFFAGFISGIGFLIYVAAVIRFVDGWGKK